MSLNDTVTNSKTETHPCFSLRGKEWIEDARSHFRAHPASCIANRDLHRTFDFFCRQGKSPTFGHGVDGVEHHVDQDFTQLRWISHDRSIRVNLQIEIDVDVV